MLRQFLSAALLLALLSAQNPIESTEPEDVSTTEQPEEETTTEEMYSTEDISSTYDSDSDSDSDSESESGSSSSDMSSTDSSDSGSDDDSDESSDNDSSSSDSDNVNTVSAEDDNDTDDNTDVFGAEGEGTGDDGRALDSESDDQDSSDSDSSSDDDVSSTAQGEDDDEEEDADTDFDDAGDDDVCLGLDSSECGNTFGDDGMQLCGYNTNTDDCFEVVMTAGQRGRGNFDDGYTMAQQELDEQASELYTVIGILGGLVGLLMLTVMGGGYYIYSNKKQFDYGHSAVPMNIIDIDGGRSTTRGQHERLESHSYHHSADITPMLDTM